ncbi:MAG: hypothetical protein QOE73_1671, partial [Verrucomicrobiota bacterium]
AAQHDGQAHIALAGLENQLATRQDASFPQWLKQRKLVIVQRRKGDTFRVAIKLFVLLLVRRHSE